MDEVYESIKERCLTQEVNTANFPERSLYAETSRTAGRRQTGEEVQGGVQGRNHIRKGQVRTAMEDSETAGCLV
jgi:hypothetical protein